MSSSTSPSFSGLKTIVVLCVAGMGMAIINAKFVRDGEHPEREIAANALTVNQAAAANARTLADTPTTVTPASMDYHDDINVSAIAGAAYDR